MVCCSDCGIEIDIYWDLADKVLCPKCWFDSLEDEMRD